MSPQPVEVSTQVQQPLNRRLIVAAVVGALLVGLLALLSLRSESVLGDGRSVLVLAIPAFLAGVLSFLSPCTLPILPAYFAFTFQAQRQNVVAMSLAFFMGLATSLSVLFATATALSGLVFDNRAALTFWGGVIVIIFGLMGILGKGFAGPQLMDRPVASFAGSYIYGATFALGMTPCVGPILAALLALLAATTGVAIVQGVVLAFIYALGLGLPLMLLATFFQRLGNGSRFWRFIKGRGFEVKVAGRTLYLHSTSMISGALMVIMGLLLATGRLEAISQLSSSGPLAQWWVSLESSIGALFGIR
ncbi:MAG: cytochrome c biogenesis CcdA family protein [Chloroflexaceae bacterium]|jgi:cytochrome c-type biogenesis protein|nr:cytochrome c biogenesis CcdA family protein [Chloroflexaceae bacterium]